MKVPLKKEIYDLENRAASRYAIPKLVLMENAGSSLFHFIESRFGNAGYKKFLVVCGAGNNGGDGAVLARKLHLAFSADAVTVVLAGGTKGKMPEEASVNFKILEKMNLPVVRYGSLKQLGKVRSAMKKSDVIVDAIFGIGYRPKQDRRMEKLINLINASGKPVVAVDLPSGVMADGGAHCPVRADFTVSFGFPKLGTIDFPGREFTGRRFVFPIDLPREIAEAPGVRRELVTHDLAARLLKPRKADSHKGNYGHLLLIGGSSGGKTGQSMTGAVILAGMAALRSGAGLLSIAVPDKILPVIQKDLPESMTFGLDDGLEGLESFIRNRKIGTALIGTGFGSGDSQKKIIAAILINKTLRKIVIDADGLNNISESASLRALLKKAARSGKDIVVTPHVKEMSRLTGADTDEVRKDKMSAAAGYSAENRLVTVLKDTVSFLSSADGFVRINETGSPALAKGGSGDVLAGMIAGLMASGYDGFTAATLGCYLLGRAGELYAGKFGTESALSRDIVNFIPECFRELHFK